MALDELLDEHEQSERVRKWLKDNSLGLIGGLAIGLALIGGWKWWQNHAHQQRLQANAAYQDAQARIAAGELDKAATDVAALQESAYAGVIALDLAKAQLDAGKRDEAIATLRNLRTEDPGLAAVGTQRLARLLIDAGQAQEALAVLGDAQDAASLETSGDARFALGQFDDARKAYESALTQLDVAAPQRRLLELKLAETRHSPQAGQPEAQS